jgi:hypothetical protein
MWALPKAAGSAWATVQVYTSVKDPDSSKYTLVQSFSNKKFLANKWPLNFYMEGKLFIILFSTKKVKNMSILVASEPNRDPVPNVLIRPLNTGVQYSLLR